MRRGAPVLDYSAHPHIIEDIVSYAPLSALISLRATCRGLRRLADARLFAHVQLQQVGTGRSQSTFLTLPARTSLTPVSDVPRLPWSLGHIRALDVDTAVTLRDGSHKFPKLHTLRRVHNTEVVVIHLHDFEGVHTVIDCIAVPKSSTRYDVCFTLPRHARRSILHISYPRLNTHSPRISMAPYTSLVDDFTFVFWPPEDKLPHVWALEWQYDTIYYAVAYAGTKYAVTVVGWEKVSPRLADAIELGGDVDAALEAERTAARDHFEQGVGSGRLLSAYQPAEMADLICNNMRVLTLEDWHRELGDRRELEGEFIRLRQGDARAGRRRSSTAQADIGKAWSARKRQAQDCATQ
ncbi:uncharacterized protein LOC62_04G005331 [Vanrija pseudolonga]|uniref:F-box domain-containing protein n=1 Tax=Vanrija pseudolonga TaxID=143232 RepID=A0AAF0Y9F9_9TREE|nr:hypothetical protein LOC62_04G005331 [Vanrija pseudolonga]